MPPQIATFLGAFLLGSSFLGTCNAHDAKGIAKEMASSTPQIEAALAELQTADLETRSVVNNLRLWPVPKKLTVCFLAGSPALRKRVTESMKKMWPIHQLTEGRLEFDSDSFAGMKDCATQPVEDIRIDFKAKEGYWSYVGLESRRHTPSMNLQGFTETSPVDSELDRLVGHETGHALGLEHEHQSPGAPECGWNFTYIFSHYSWKDEKDMHNNFDKLTDYVQNNKHAYIFSTYDKKSLMHYDFEADAFDQGTKSRCFITRNCTPSDTDRLAIRIAYGPDISSQQALTRDVAPQLKEKLSKTAYDGIVPLLKAKIESLPQ